jgi:membrane fusion protein (multidrug efflux system)
MSTTQTIPAGPSGQAAPGSAPAITKKSGRKRAFLIFFTVLALLAIGGLALWLNAQQYESTDDAEIDGHINPISARVDGTVTEVHVEDNQEVHAGDPLVDLDPRDLAAAAMQAEAAVTQASSLVTAQEPNVPITETENVTSLSTGEAEVANAEAALSAAERDRQADAAKIAQSEANNARAQADLARYKILIAKEEVSQQEFDQVAAAAKAQSAEVDQDRAVLASADQTVLQRRAQLAESQSRLAQVKRNAPRQIAIRTATVASDRASVLSARAQLEEAQLKLSYAHVTAPVAGIVMKRSAEVGARVSAGQELLDIAQISDLWVTANFKETQLHRLRHGQSTRIHVDALKQDFDGYVESVGASTGAVASVLPPENATGNYVKVVQRIPVRIRFKPNQQGLERLRPGMSVEPEVRIE